MPEPGEVAALDLAPGTPVVEAIRTAYASDGQPVEVSREMTADASAYVFRYDFTTLSPSLPRPCLCRRSPWGGRKGVAGGNLEPGGAFRGPGGSGGSPLRF